MVNYSLLLERAGVIIVIIISGWLVVKIVEYFDIIGMNER